MFVSYNKEALNTHLSKKLSITFIIRFTYGSKLSNRTFHFMVHSFNNYLRYVAHYMTLNRIDRFYDNSLKFHSASRCCNYTVTETSHCRRSYECTSSQAKSIRKRNRTKCFPFLNLVIKRYKLFFINLCTYTTIKLNIVYTKH